MLVVNSATRVQTIDNITRNSWVTWDIGQFNHGSWVASRDPSSAVDGTYDGCDVDDCLTLMYIGRSEVAVICCYIIRSLCCGATLKYFSFNRNVQITGHVRFPVHT